MADPFDSDLFPDRPDTPDFWRLSEVGLHHDGAALEEEDGLNRIINSIIDQPSLLYAIEHRLGNAGVITPATPIALKAKLMALYVDAFCLGADFIRRGGHRD